MECYFPLAAQFNTQADPAYCGLGTLAMVLNALNIDPGKVWKGPWRWYHEDMLDCCVPLDTVKEKGISVDTFACLARCNGAAATVVRVPALADASATTVDPDTISDSDPGLARCRQTIMEATKTRSGSFLIAAYSRKPLGQTGGGHYSPVGGYHAGRDMVLIMDVARFKYPPHWVPLKTLYASMRLVDPDTKRARGYVTVQRSASVPLVLFAFGDQHYRSPAGTPVAGGGGGSGHSHSHGACCTPMAKAITNGSSNNGGSSSRSTSPLARSSNCRGQGRSIAGAASHMQRAATSIDAARISLRYDEADDQKQQRNDAGDGGTGSTPLILVNDSSSMTSQSADGGGGRRLLALQQAGGVGQAAVTRAVDILLGRDQQQQEQHAPDCSNAGKPSLSSLLPLHVRLGSTELTSEDDDAGSGHAGHDHDDGGVCMTRLSRDQVASAASLLTDIEATPIYGMVRAALDGQQQKRRGSSMGEDGDGGRATEVTMQPALDHPDDTAPSPLATSGLAIRKPAAARLQHDHSATTPKSAAGGTIATLTAPAPSIVTIAGLNGPDSAPISFLARSVTGGAPSPAAAGAGGVGGSLASQHRAACGTHQPMQCVRVHTAHVVTVLLMTLYSKAQHAHGYQEPSPAVGDDVHASSVPASSILHTLVAQSLSSASPLVRAEVSLLRGQMDVEMTGHEGSEAMGCAGGACSRTS